MSRRDTIIIAVLVNAALLMILFATAMRSDHSKNKPTENAQLAANKVEEQIPLANLTEQSSSEDLLNEFISSVPTLAEEGQETVLNLEDSAMAFVPAPTEVVEASTPSVAAVEEVKINKPKMEDQFANVTVKKGDFLEKIAKANHTTVSAIMKANNLSSTQLKIGQVLKVPQSESKKSGQKSSSSVSSEAEYYIVKEGDNPWLIASRNKINLDELLRINGLDEQKAKRLRPGDKLKIR